MEFKKFSRGWLALGLIAVLIIACGCSASRISPVPPANPSVSPPVTSPTPPPSVVIDVPYSPVAATFPIPPVPTDARPLQIQVIYAPCYYLKIAVTPMTDSNGTPYPVGGKIDVFLWNQADFVSAATTAPLQSWQNVVMPTALYGSAVELEYDNFQPTLKGSYVLEVLLTTDDGTVWYSLLMDVPLGANI
jgi:hypothetical protein